MFPQQPSTLFFCELVDSLVHPLAPQQRPAPHFQKLASNTSVPFSPELVDFFSAGYLNVLKKEGEHQVNKVNKWKSSTLFYLLLEKILM